MSLSSEVLNNLKKIEYPIFSKGTYMQTGKDMTQ